MSEKRVRTVAAITLAIFGVGLGASLGHTAPAPPKASVLPASSGKPVAPIAIEYALSAPPQLGVPFDVRISVAGQDGIADVVLSVQPGNGVEVGTPRLMTSSPDGARRTWTVAATIFVEGAECLSVLAQGTAGDEHPARNLLIPIRSGAAAPTDGR